jgi:hypothetical protein
MSSCSARHETFTPATISEILEERGLLLTVAGITGAHHGCWQSDDPVRDLKEVRELMTGERRRLFEAWKPSLDVCLRCDYPKPKRVTLPGLSQWLTGLLATASFSHELRPTCAEASRQ